MIPMKIAVFLAFCLLSTAMLPTSLAAKLGLGLLAAVLAIVFKHFSPRERLPIDNKSVLVTGCDTGFGLALAKHLHSLGFFVYAGCLLKNAGGNGAKELEDIDPDRLVVMQLDVTSDQQVQEAVKLILETLPDRKQGLWAVVNNAGVSSFGEVEWCTMDKYKFIYDVNVHGMIRVTKAVLPLIRKAKGRVINMASGISRHGAPSRSLYCTSKFAVQGFSDCLRYEMHRWGVHVSIIEPGNFVAATGILTEAFIDKTAKELWDGMPSNVQSEYGREYFDTAMHTIRSYCSAADGKTEMAPVIDAYTDAIISKRPKIRYYAMDLYWNIRRLAFTHLPERISDRLYYGVKYQ